MLYRVVARPSATSPGPGTTASSTVDGALAMSPSIASLGRDRLLMDEQSGGCTFNMLHVYRAAWPGLAKPWDNYTEINETYNCARIAVA